MNNNKPLRILLLLIPFLVITIISYLYQNRPLKYSTVAYSTENLAEDIIEEEDNTNDNTDVKSNDELVLSENTETDTTKRLIKIGAVFEDYTNSTGSITSMEKSLGISFSAISIFKQFGHPQNKDLNQDNLSFIKNSGKMLMISWEPWNPDEGTQQGIDYLSEITNGAQDAYINSFIISIKEYAAPVVIRFGHEMNGDWYPWGNKQNEYKAAYIYLHNIFRENEVNNVSWLWSINSNSVPDEPITNVAKYYPGNEFVDIIGIDGFNYGTSQNQSSWRNFKEIFLPSYNFIISNYNKQIIISEISSAEQGGDKSTWVNEMFYALNNDFSSIEEVVWFNLIKEADWRFDSTQSSLEAFRRNLQ